MKAIFSYLAILILPIFVSAQPTEAAGEFYYIGDAIHMMICDTTGLYAGADGAAATWDFSGIVPLGMSTTTYAAEQSPSFITCNIVATSPSGQKVHEQENNTDTYIDGIEDSTSGNIIYYSRYNISKRPLTYNTSYLDTFFKTVPTTSEHGRGILTVRGDAYGTLILPTGTYNNVLRVKKVQTEIDSLGSDIYYTTTLSYLWFDNTHRPPLLRIDSVNGSLGQSRSMMYLANPTAVGHVNNQINDFKGYLNNSDLMLSGSFETGAVYEVTVYNIIGSVILKEEFTTPNNYYHVEVPGQLTSGIYVVTLLQKNDPSSKNVIKVIKQ